MSWVTDAVLSDEQPEGKGKVIERTGRPYPGGVDYLNPYSRRYELSDDGWLRISATNGCGDELAVDVPPEDLAALVELLTAGSRADGGHSPSS